MSSQMEPSVEEQGELSLCQAQAGKVVQLALFNGSLKEESAKDSRWLGKRLSGPVPARRGEVLSAMKI